MSDVVSSSRRTRTASYVLGAFALFFVVHWLTGSGWHRLESLALVGVACCGLVLIALWPHRQAAKQLPSEESGLWKDLNFRAAVENSLDDFYIFTGVEGTNGKLVDFRFAYINPSAERRLRVQRGELLGKTLAEVRPVAVSLGLIDRYAEVVRTGFPLAEEVFLDDDRIHATWLHVHAVKLGNGIAITSRDITERKRVTDHASYLAEHDQLTGLANRTLLLSRMKGAITHAQAMQQRVAVFVVDVDNFKQINDSLGHMMGDRLLGIVAKRLLGAVRDTDTVARLGGDEFVIVMPSFRELADVERCAEKIIAAVYRPITIDGQKINVSISSGYSIYPDTGVNVDELLQNADMAMYSVKNDGRNGFRAFDSAKDSTIA